MRVRIERAGDGFNDWNQLLKLLRGAFDYQRSRIEPPSSIDRMDERSLAQKAGAEQLILAWIDDALAGCVFVRDRPASAYLSKLAVCPRFQGRGTGRRLVQAAEALARERGKTLLDLETRIELTENHETFVRLGFVKVSEHAHPGYDRPTFIAMRKRIGV